MALADPQSITVAGAAVSLPRVLTKTGAGQFTSADGAYQIEVLPTKGKTNVRTVRLRNSKVTSDPLVTTTNVRVQDLISVTIIRPLDGYSDQEILDQWTALAAWFAASTFANAKKVIAGEN